MRLGLLALSLVLTACGDDAEPDGGVDAAVDAALDAAPPGDGGTDGFVRLPPPACDALPAVAPPACGTGDVARGSLIPGPGDPGLDADLLARATRFDRGFHALHAWGTGVNTEVVVGDAGDRMLVERFLLEDDGWDFEAFSGRTPDDLLVWQKVAGAYGGAGITADAFRYAVLRDSGAPCEEVDRARGHLARDLDVLHTVTAITGVPGVIARGFIRRDLPGGEIETTPLFDMDGQPLPAEKNNGTWREDNSGGLYPELIWEDSCSRDMLIGWVLGMAAAWEIVEADPTFDDADKARLRGDARDIARSLMQVGEDGYDLEIHDADGRLTFHGYLNEHAIDRAYLASFDNGQHAIMALGILAALARISGDAEVADYVFNDLIRDRRLHEIARDRVMDIDFGTAANFSNYNMAFTGGWLASRYLCDEEARAAVAAGIEGGLYDTPGRERQPAEQGQSFYDLVYVAARAGATASAGLGPDIDGAAVTRALSTLSEMPVPYWDVERINCDDAEIAAMTCVADDGTALDLLGYVGRGDTLVAAQPVPMRVRPPSNYHWRSDPYRVNGGGDGSRLLPAVDFRLAYWTGRHLKGTD